MKITFGPPRYFVPICIRWPWGFMGGPSGYEEVGEEERNRGPIIVKGNYENIPRPKQHR